MKVVIVSIAYAPARVILACYEQLYKTIGITPSAHLVLNNHYPVNQNRNDRLIKSICEEFGCTLYDLGENVGLQRGYNYLIEQANLEDNDIIIGVDSDVWPITPNWGPALVKTIQEPSFAWATLQNQHSKRELTERGHTEIILNGIKLQMAHYACTNSICAWRKGVVKELGGLQEPRKFYGSIESHMFPMVKKINKHWVYLSEYHEEFSPLVESDLLYKRYKIDYAIKLTTTLEFKEWLKLESQQ